MNARVVSGTMLLGLISGTAAQLYAGSQVVGWPAISGGNGVFPAVDTRPISVSVRQWSAKRDSVEWFQTPVVPWSRDARPAERTYGVSWTANTGAISLTEALATDGWSDWEDRQEVDKPATGVALEGCCSAEIRAFDAVIALYEASQVDPILAPCSNKMMIPAPGAVLLGGLGVVLIGWLRRRRSL